MLFLLTTRIQETVNFITTRQRMEELYIYYVSDNIKILLTMSFKIIEHQKMVVLFI